MDALSGKLSTLTPESVLTVSGSQSFNNVVSTCFAICLTLSKF